MVDTKVGGRAAKRRIPREENIASAWRVLAEAKEDAKQGKTAPTRSVPKFEDDEPAMVDCVVRLDEEKQVVVIEVACPYDSLDSGWSHVNQVRVPKEAWLKVVRKKWFGEALDEEDRKALLSGDTETVRKHSMALRARAWTPYDRIEVYAPDCWMYLQRVRCLFCGHLLTLAMRIPDWVYKEMPRLGV